MKLLKTAFFQQKTELVARTLLGKKLIRIFEGQILSGIIVETEAYGFSDDPASHSHRGKTNRTAPMFGTVGCAYVYFIYGNHFCFNIVAKDCDSLAGAVLIRALQPVCGINTMQLNRNKMNEQNLMNGPGKLAQALQINKNHNFVDLTKKGELFVAEGSAVKPKDIIVSSRVGISKAKQKPWRFFIRDNNWVS